MRGRPFAKGYDPRRHILSKEECRKGYIQATQTRRLPSQIRAWLRNKLRRRLQQKREGTLPQGPGYHVPREEWDW